MVIEVEAWLPVGRGTDSHGSSPQLLPWQAELGQPWARGWMEMTEGKEGPAGIYPSLTHFAELLTDAASCTANVPIQLATKR